MAARSDMLASAGLRVRSTFLEAFNPQEQDRRVKRSLSEGDLAERAHVCPLDEERLAHAAALAEGLAALGGPSDLRQYFGHTADTLKADPAASEDPTLGGSTSAPSPSSNDAEVEGSQGSNDDSLSFSMQSSRVTVRADAMGCEEDTCWQANEVAEKPASATGLAACSVGSIGHPELCSRACLRAATGQCHLGQACPYCHMPHNSRLTHLDRKHREYLSGVSPKTWLGVFGPELSRRAEAAGLEPALAAHLQGLLRRCAALPCGDPGAERPLPKRCFRSTVVLLQSMSTKAVISAASRTVRQYSEEVGDLLCEFLHSWRASIGNLGDDRVDGGSH